MNGKEGKNQQPSEHRSTNPTEASDRAVYRRMRAVIHDFSVLAVGVGAFEGGMNVARPGWALFYGLCTGLSAYASIYFGSSSGRESVTSAPTRNGQDVNKEQK